MRYFKCIRKGFYSFPIGKVLSETTKSINSEYPTLLDFVKHSPNDFEEVFENNNYEIY